MIDRGGICDRGVVVITGIPLGGQWSFPSRVSQTMDPTTDQTNTKMIDLKQIFIWGKVLTLLTPDEEVEVSPHHQYYSTA